MKKSIVRFDRKFQIWLYSASHGQLLLRSTKDETHATQVDVLFKGTALIHIPVFFSGLTISEISESEFRSLKLSTGLYPIGDRKCLKLEGDDWEGVIVAGYVGWLEEDAPHSADSKLFSKVP